MTDDLDRDFEDRVRRMLASSVAGLPESYEATSGLVRRARRHRAARLTAVVATVVLAATGTTTAVAQVLARHGGDPGQGITPRPPYHPASLAKLAGLDPDWDS